MDHEELLSTILEETDLNIPHDIPFYRSSSEDYVENPYKRKKKVLSRGTTLIWPFLIATEQTASGYSVKLYYMSQSHEKLLAKATGLSPEEASHNVMKIRDIVRGR